MNSAKRGNQDLFEASAQRPKRGQLILIAIVFFVVGYSVNTFVDQIINRGGSPASGDLPSDLNYASVEEFYDKLRANYDGNLSEQELLDGLKKGLADATGDPYTTYLNEEETKSFRDDLNGTFSGIGAELGEKEGVIEVVAPLEGYPAQQAGLRPGDVILKIDDTETTGMSIEEAVTKIRGPEGTDVKLQILRGQEPLEFTITRQTITVPSVESEILDGNIGYMQITRFAEDTADLTRAAAEDFKARGVKGVIVDVRNNSGGYLESSVEVAGIWLNDKVVVEQRRGEQVQESLKSGRTPILEGIPTVVLVNEGSASASEILAGALLDHGAATLIGATTYGKGSVQSLEQLRGGGVLKVTIARWFTPKGINIDQEGIKPNIEVIMTNEDYDNDRDPQKDRAINEILN